MSKIKPLMDTTKVMKVKGIQSYYDNIPLELRRNRFMSSFAKHTTTKREEGEILKNENIALKYTTGLVKGVTSIATNLISTGINFVLPANLFWDNMFCVLATSKSYV